MMAVKPVDRTSSFDRPRLCPIMADKRNIVTSDLVREVKQYWRLR